MKKLTMIAIITALTATFALTACKDYTDDLTDIGERVERL